MLNVTSNDRGDLARTAIDASPQADASRQADEFDGLVAATTRACERAVADTKMASDHLETQLLNHNVAPGEANAMKVKMALQGMKASLKALEQCLLEGKLSEEDIAVLSEAAGRAQRAEGVLALYAHPTPDFEGLRDAAVMAGGIVAFLWWAAGGMEGPAPAF